MPGRALPPGCVRSAPSRSEWPDWMAGEEVRQTRGGLARRYQGWIHRVLPRPQARRYAYLQVERTRGEGVGDPEMVRPEATHRQQFWTIRKVPRDSVHAAVAGDVNGRGYRISYGT